MTIKADVAQKYSLKFLGEILVETLRHRNERIFLLNFFERNIVEIRIEAKTARISFPLESRC